MDGSRDSIRFDAREGFLETRHVSADGGVSYGRQAFHGISAAADGPVCLSAGGKSWRGIARLEGPRVRLCFSRSGKQPTCFDVTDDTFEWLIQPVSVPVKR
jgi:hypothetical protein